MLLHAEVVRDRPLVYLHTMAGSFDGIFHDWSGNGRDLTWGTLNGAGVVADGGRGVVCDGSTDGFILTASWMANNTMSIEAWFTTTSSSLISLWNRRALNNVWGVYHDPSGASLGVAGIGMVVGDASHNNFILGTTSLYNEGRLHHTVCIFDYDGANTYGSIYVDGALIAGRTSLFSGSINTQTDRLWLGGEDTIRKWTGTLDHCALYDYALDPARVKAHYVAGIGRQPRQGAWRS